MRKSERRESILQAASELFGSKGYLETKMSDIADACGIAKGTMYEYFSSKDELAAEWCRNFFKEYESCIERRVMIHITPSERLKALIRLDLEYFRRFTGHFFVVFQPEKLFHSEKSDFLTEIASILTYHYQLITSIVKDGQKCGEFRNVDPVFCAVALIGMFLSFQRAKNVMNAEHSINMFDSLQQIASEWNDDILIDYFLNGLAA